MIADSTDLSVRGKAFGIHRTLDTAGAIGGSSLAILLFWLFGLSCQAIIGTAAAIAFISLIPFYWVRDVRHRPVDRSLGLNFRAMPNRLRHFVLVSAVFALGNFASWFFVLRAWEFLRESGAPEGRAATAAIALCCLFNVIYAAFSVPIDILSDRIGRGRVLLAGYLLQGRAFLCFALRQSIAGLVVFFILYGLICAFVKGAERAFVCDMAPEDARGTA